MKHFGKEYHRQWRRDHPEACRKASYKWRALNPDKSAAINNRYEISEKRISQRRKRAESGESNRAALRFRYKVEGRYRTLRYTAKYRGIPCDLPFEVYSGIVAMPCDYCEKPTGFKTGSGIDRKDSRLGYTIANSVSCCSSCNRVKNNVLSYDEMKFVMARLNEYRTARDQPGKV